MEDQESFLRDEVFSLTLMATVQRAGVYMPGLSETARDKASQAFSELRGVKKIEVHIATCPGRKRMKTWKHLESARLATFRQLHFELPKYNRKKGSVNYVEEIKLFKKSALEDLLLQFTQP